MIGHPFVTVRCDGENVDQGGQCRASVIFEVPSFISDGEQLGRLFATVHEGWLTSGRKALCPHCVTRRLAARAEAARAAREKGGAE